MLPFREPTAEGFHVLIADADPQQSAQSWATVAGNNGSPAPTVVGVTAGFHRPGQLPELARGYDFTIIDTPPNDGGLVRSALMVARLALLPVIPGALEVWVLGETLKLVEDAQTFNTDLEHRVLLNAAMRTRLTQNTREALEELGGVVMKSEIGRRTDIAEAIAFGVGVTVHAPKSKAAAEVRAAVDEVLEVLSGRAALRVAG